MFIYMISISPKYTPNLHPEFSQNFPLKSENQFLDFVSYKTYSNYLQKPTNKTKLNWKNMLTNKSFKSLFLSIKYNKIKPRIRSGLH